MRSFGLRQPIPFNAEGAVWLQLRDQFRKIVFFLHLFSIFVKWNWLDVCYAHLLNTLHSHVHFDLFENYTSCHFWCCCNSLCLALWFVLFCFFIFFFFSLRFLILKLAKWCAKKGENCIDERYTLNHNLMHFKLHLIIVIAVYLGIY